MYLKKNMYNLQLNQIGNFCFNLIEFITAFFCSNKQSEIKGILEAIKEGEVFNNDPEALDCADRVVVVHPYPNKNGHYQALIVIDYVDNACFSSMQKYNIKTGYYFYRDLNGQLFGNDCPIQG